MISVVVATLNSAETIVATLEGLIPAAVQGLVREVIIADGGSTDATLHIAEGCGATCVSAGPTRAARLIEGANQAKFPWLLFLDADTALDPGFERDIETFITRVEDGRIAPSAATFAFRIDDNGIAPRMVEMAARWGSALFGLAHAKQGLLIPRSLYAERGGYKLLADLEDIDLTRRIGRTRLVRLRRPLVSHCGPYRRTGYANRALRHAGRVLLYALRVPLKQDAARQDTLPASSG